jgi:hypothetical protein
MIVVTKASGGLPVVDVGAGKLGLPVYEAINGMGVAITKVTNFGLPVTWVGETAPEPGEDNFLALGDGSNELLLSNATSQLLLTTDT